MLISSCTDVYYIGRVVSDRVLKIVVPNLPIGSFVPWVGLFKCKLGLTY